MKKNNPLNDKIEKIVIQLYKNEGMMSANELSKLTGISYVVVQKYLKILEEKGIVHLVRIRKKPKKDYPNRGETKRYELNPLLTMPRFD